MFEKAGTNGVVVVKLHPPPPPTCLCHKLSVNDRFRGVVPSTPCLRLETNLVIYYTKQNCYDSGMFEYVTF